MKDITIITRKNSVASFKQYLSNELETFNDVHLSVVEELEGSFVMKDGNYVLIVEDEKNYIVDLVINFLNSDCFDTILVIQNYESFLACKERIPKPAISTLDFQLGEMENMYSQTGAIYSWLKGGDLSLPVIGLTNWEIPSLNSEIDLHSDIKKLIDLLNSNGDSVFDKSGFELGRSKILDNIVRDKLRISSILKKQKKLEIENESLRNENTIYKDKITEEIQELSSNNKFDPTFRVLEKPLIGESKVLNEIKYWIQRYSNTKNSAVNVHLYGPTGCGKGNIASAIHRLDKKRCQKGFVTLDCPNFPEELFISELFGYEPGAFTSASDKGFEGKINGANGGVLFLDEIGDLSLANQAKVLRLIDEKRFMKLKGKKEIYIDVKVITASHKNLYELVEKGLFREDLYYRLKSRFPAIPGLDERREDIPLIANYFAKLYDIKLSQGSEDYLESLDYRGNIRQLKKIIESLSITMDAGDTVDFSDLVRTLEDLQFSVRPHLENKALLIANQMLKIVESDELKKKYTQSDIAKYWPNKQTGGTGLSREVFLKSYYNKYKKEIISIITSEGLKFEPLTSKCNWINKEVNK